MRFSSLLAVVAAAAGASAHLNSPRSVGREWCGTKYPTEAQLEQSRKLAATERDDGLEARTVYSVDVYFHVIALSQDSEEDGWLSVSQILFHNLELVANKM